MKNVKDFNSGEILRIPLDKPELLFSVANLKLELRILHAGWHPDRNLNSKASEVFIHVTKLYEQALYNIEHGLWDGPATLEIQTINNGAKFQFKYRRVQEIDLGKMYVGMDNIVYVIKPEFKDLYLNGIKMINAIQYKEKKYEDQFKRHLPNIIKTIESDIGFVVVISKTPDLVLLKDLLEYLPDNKLLPVHTAWIMSSLNNLLCFLEMNRIAHGAISSNTLWISPKHHSVVLLGGWWYARNDGDNLLALPKESIDILPKEIFVDKIGKTKYDISLMKALGLESLGDKTHIGSTLLKDTTIPSSVLGWLRSANASSAVKEYKQWSIARDTGFGVRKFVDLVVDINKIY